MVAEAIRAARKYADEYKLIDVIVDENGLKRKDPQQKQFADFSCDFSSREDDVMLSLLPRQLLL